MAAVKRKRPSFIRSFFLALGGILRVIKKERNIKVQFLIALLAVLVAGVVDLTRTEWLFLILIIFSVLAAETFNSSLEEVCDLLHQKLPLDYQETKWIRDISAGAVLLLAIASAVLGLIIFLPHFFPV